MNIIEQATRRLEELRRAGIEVPGVALGASASGAAVLDAPTLLRETAPAPAPVSAAPPAALPVAEPAIVPVPEPAPVVDRSIGKRSREVTIDLDRLASQGYLTPNLSDRVLAEQMRVIKMALIKNTEVAAVNADCGAT